MQQAPSQIYSSRDCLVASSDVQKNKSRNKKGKTKKKKLGEFLNTHKHTFSRVSLLKIKKIKINNNNNNKLGFHTSIPSLVCHYLKSKRKGYNRNQNIKYTT